MGRQIRRRGRCFERYDWGGETAGCWREGDVQFVEADCAVPRVDGEGGFDVVFGGWLLNYAAERRGLVDMFRNIALDLKDGGGFVGVTVPPAEEPIVSFWRRR